MCTVTFVAVQGRIIITSNRDEQVERRAQRPRSYNINQKQVFFPKDPKAGGTWFAVDQKANVVVLLNGASEKHQWNPPYRKSRGLLVLDLIGSDSAFSAWQTINLAGVEPFTIVLYEQQQLHQLRWNGAQKETVTLDAKRNYIWSSTTLYPKNIRDERAQWFEQFLEKPNVDQDEMLHFHRYTENDDAQNGLIIDRNSQLKTLSITQAVIENNQMQLLHHDLIEEQEAVNTFLIV